MLPAPEHRGREAGWPRAATRRSRISLRGSIVRCLLRVRKAAAAWDMPVDELRRMQQWSDRLVRAPREVEITQAADAPGAAEWMAPRVGLRPGVILYVHGGGWTLPLHNPERRLLARFCRAAGVPALAVDYRLAPEHVFPDALEDCVAAYRWVVKSRSPMQTVVMGTSAGGNLMLAMLMSLRDAGNRLPAAAVCISPMVDLAGTGESFTADRDPAVAARFALAMARYYAAGQDVRLPLISPVHGDLRGLPPLLIHVGEDEIVLSDAMRLHGAARAAGVDARLVVWPKMWHGWHLFGACVPEAQQAIRDIEAFVCERLKGADT